MAVLSSKKVKPSKKSAVSLGNASASKPAALSAEFVDDSDSSDSPPVAVKPAKSAPRKQSQDSKSIKSSEATPKSAIKKLPKRVDPVSSESESESADDDRHDGTQTESSDEEEESSTSSKVNNHAAPAVTLVPDSQQSQNTKLPKTPQYKVNPVNGVKRKVDEASLDPEQNNVAGSDTSDSESGSENSSSGADNGSTIPSARKDLPPVTTIEKQIEHVYRPPPGFEPATISFTSASALAEVLAPSNLKGKQVWHITAPAGLPLNTVNAISAETLQNGSSVMSHEGSEYGFMIQAADEGSDTTLLLPSQKGSVYKASPIPITSSVQLQQIIEVPSSITKADPNASTGPVVSRIQQPENLKMRYHAFGLSDHPGSARKSSNKPAQKQTQLTAPAGSNNQSQSKKRKHKEPGADTQSPDSPAAEPKRQRTDPEAAMDQKTREMINVETSAVPENSAVLVQDDHGVNGTTPVVRLSHNLETPEQRAQRKAEKRRRKELRRSARAEDHHTNILSTAQSASDIIGLDDFQQRSEGTQSVKQLPTPNHSSPHKQAGSRSEKARRRAEKQRLRTALAQA